MGLPRPLLVLALVPALVWGTLHTGLAQFSGGVTRLSGQSMQAAGVQWWPQLGSAANGPAFAFTAAQVTIQSPVVVECVAGVQTTLRGRTATASSLSLDASRLDAGSVRLTGFMSGWDAGGAPGTSASSAVFEGHFALTSLDGSVSGLQVQDPQVSVGRC